MEYVSYVTSIFKKVNVRCKNKARAASTRLSAAEQEKYTLKGVTTDIGAD